MTDISLIGLDSIVLQPRILKALEHQKERTRNHAEVFTAAWICNKMINYFDDEWNNHENKTWQQYVDLKVLEITCGEAPYLVSRYDTSTGKIIDMQNRIGVLDRKKGLKQFGYNQINDYKLSKFYFYPDSKEIFGNSADLSDGISIVIKSIQI